MQDQISARATVIVRSAWVWLAYALALAASAFLWSRIAIGALETARFTLVWLALLTGGIGLALSLQQRSGTSSTAAPVPLLFLAAVFTVTALGATANLVASWFGSYWIGFRPGLCFIVWLFVAPLSARAVMLLLGRLPKGARFERGDSAAFALLACSITAYLAMWALETAEPALMNWVTIQRFLAVMAALALVAAPLAVVDVPMRRVVLSGLVVFHLGGIVCAALGSPPTPWIVNQLWVRIYRPYLQFMYLNNAYHFYSPQPGPPCHLWFRLYYTDDQGERQAQWYKIPYLDDDGRHGHTTSLEYQRYLSITVYSEMTERFLTDSDAYKKVLALRLAWTPEGAKKAAVLGQAPLQHEILIPMHRDLAPSLQFHHPQIQVKWLMESYVRHVFHKHAQKHPDRHYTSMRVYRVIHAIPPTGHFLHENLEANDPATYSPIYMGEYGTDGKLLDKNDPFLYWLLPIQREPPAALFSPIKDWARRHAGDRYWIRDIQHGFFVWVDDDGNAAPE